MSATIRNGRKTVRDIVKGGAPSVWLTAYTTPIARLLDPHVDVLLVGDSLGMVLYGFDSTLPVTLDIMIAHGGAVVRGSTKSMVVVDMPWASYQASPAQAYANAARVMAETGCAAVKIEGGAVMADTVRFLVERGIPVCGHVGLMPQAVHTSGGFSVKGRGEQDALKVKLDAEAIAEAGAFAIVLEGTVEPVSRSIAETVNVPIIGIGASPACDGQVLVIDDVIGTFNDFTPKFVRRFANLSPDISAAAEAYAAAVRERSFPAMEHCFGMKKA